jgi:thiol-disulfide isomerase/thioredoxin
MALLLVLSWFAALPSQAGVFPPPEQARADIDAGIAQAKAQHKRLLIDFGADWCPDCRALLKALQRPENEALLNASYVLVRVNVGDTGITDNFDIAERYGIPLKKGVPALVVLDDQGRPVYAQTNGEFESLRDRDPQTVNDFLNRWKQP